MTAGAASRSCSLLAAAAARRRLSSRGRATTTASAAVGDQIDSFTIDYEMGTDGVLQAKETIV